MKEHIYWVAGISGGLVVIIHLLDMFWGRDAALRKWLKIFLKHIVDEHLAGDLYAVPIALNDQTIWGVVIVDNCRTEEHDFKADLQDYMSSYMKIINFSLSSIKKS